MPSRYILKSETMTQFESTSIPTFETYQMRQPHPNRLMGGAYEIGLERRYSQPNYPLVTVITVVYNAADTIAATIQSVLTQTYGNLDFIVIDGGSTDGTLEVIRRHENRLSLWLSEPDNGIYDAMNKGISMIEDEESYILFLNADDYLADANSIERIISRSRYEDFLYGKIALMDEGFLVHLGHPHTKQSLAFGMAFHQATLTKCRVFRKLGLFDTRYRLAADYEFAVRVFSNAVTTRFVYETVSVMRIGGASNKHFRESFSEKKHIIIRYYTGFQRLMALGCINCYDLPRNTIGQVLTRLGVLKYWRALKLHVK